MFADREKRVAREQAEAKRVHQRVTRDRDADLEKRDKALAEQEAELTRHRRAHLELSK